MPPKQRTRRRNENTRVSLVEQAKPATSSASPTIDPIQRLLDTGRLAPTSPADIEFLREHLARGDDPSDASLELALRGWRCTQEPTAERQQQFQQAIRYHRVRSGVRALYITAGTRVRLAPLETSALAPRLLGELGWVAHMDGRHSLVGGDGPKARVAWDCGEATWESPNDLEEILEDS